MPRVGIRADGGAVVGMGHIMRCLTLAKELHRNGCRVYFLSRLAEGIGRIEEEGFEVIRLCSPEWDKEGPEVVEAIDKYNIDLLLIDSYSINYEYFLKFKPHVNKLGYIDDLNSFVYPVDILINGNITAQFLEYEKYSEKEVMLLGPKYNLIRGEFRNLPQRNVNSEVKEIMVTTGGGDPYDISSRIIDILLESREFRDLRINLIVGSAFGNKPKLRDISIKHDNVVLHENTRNMSKIILRSDIAISAGGSTLYELCACGTPVLAFIIADNQIGIVEKMSEQGYIKSLGWYNRFSEHQLLKALSDISGDYEERVALSRKMQELVDGQGVVRVVESIMKLLEENDQW